MAKVTWTFEVEMGESEQIVALRRLIDAGLTFGAATITFAERRTPMQLEYAERAARLFASEDDIEVDNHAIVLEQDEVDEPEGAWVMGWLWLEDRG